MKKDVLKQVFIIAGSVSLVLLLIGLVQTIANFDDFVSFSQSVNTIILNAKERNKLMTYILSSFILNLFAFICLFALPFLKYIKNSKSRKILFYSISILILILCITSSILSRIAGKPYIHGTFYDDSLITRYDITYVEYKYYLFYQSNLTSVLAFSIPAIILIGCILAYNFIRKKEDKENNSNFVEEDTKKDSN